MDTPQGPPLTSRQVRRIRQHIEYLGRRNKAVAVRAENNLIRFYGARALPQLIEATRSRSSQVRLRAAWVLGTTGDPRAYDTLLRLTNDRNDAVRFDSRIALGMLGDPRAVPILIDLDLNDPLDHGAAAMGLVRLYPACHEAAIELARSDDRAKQALGAYVLDLSNTLDPSAFEALGRLVDVTDEDTQDRAFSALARWRDKPAIDLAQRCLQHAEPAVRASAVRWCATIAEEDARWLPLVEASTTDTAPDVRHWAYWSLANQLASRVEPDRLEQILATALADEDEAVRHDAMYGLFTALPRSRHTRAVAALLSAPSTDTRCLVESTLLGMLGSGWTACILACLAATGNPKYLPVVEAKLQDQSALVRRSAGRAARLLTQARKRRTAGCDPG